MQTDCRHIWYQSRTKAKPNRSANHWKKWRGGRGGRDIIKNSVHISIWSRTICHSKCVTSCGYYWHHFCLLCFSFWVSKPFQISYFPKLKYFKVSIVSIFCIYTPLYCPHLPCLWTWHCSNCSTCSMSQWVFCLRIKLIKKAKEMREEKERVKQEEQEKAQVSKLK